MQIYMYIFTHIHIHTCRVCVAGPTHIVFCHVAVITSPPIGGGRGIVMPMSVCVFVRVFAKCQSVISQSFLNRSS